MQLPVFFLEQIPVQGSLVSLPDETVRHILTVLRMRENESIALTDGRGIRATAVISSISKKNCEVRIESTHFQERPGSHIVLAVSLLKNANRFEWMLEKVTELGVGAIVPLLCHRTERQHFRADRMKNILISAMLQSQQSWLPELSDPETISSFFKREMHLKYIAHCLPGAEYRLKISDAIITGIMIGPEGDFSPEEIKDALDHGFLPVTLGANRLRSETAAVAAVTLLALR